MKMRPVIFREYDIRGVYNSDFDTDFATELGKAITSFTSRKFNKNNPTITLGFDARHSSPEIISALAKGISSVGGNVIHLGMVTTPISYFSTFTVDKVDGGIMVTGSHNPPEYNGFKISVGKTTIHGTDIKSLETLITKKDYISNGVGSISELDIMPSYLERYKKEFGQLKNIPLVLDCGNGAAGTIARRLYEAVGLKPIILFENPDGSFPNHHPDPTVEENLKDLAKSVKDNQAAVGIGFDGDADRIGVVDHEGNMVSGDDLIALYAQFVLKENPGKKIIGDVKCSDRLYDNIRKHGGEPIMWMTGHSLIKDKVKAEASPFGGELSGHIFFADRNYGYDDAPYAGLRIMEILSQTGKTIRELLDMPTAFNTPEIRIDTTEEKKHSIVTKIKEAYPPNGNDYQINLIDGIRISFKDGWALVRASNTQPVIVLRFESDSKQGLDRIQTKIESLVKPLL